MGNLIELFISLQTNPCDFLPLPSSRKGADEEGRDFEDMIAFNLSEFGYEKISLEKFPNLPSAKTKLQSYKFSDKTPNHSNYQSHFIPWPAGSQGYPDFLIMNGNALIGLEVKYSKNRASPMWNGGLPRPHGIYIFGSRKRGDITFFMGRDILSPDDTEKLHSFFERLEQDVDDFNHQNMKGQSYGFRADRRKTFSQGKQYNKDAVTDYFTNPSRYELEGNVIEYVRNCSD